MRCFLYLLLLMGLSCSAQKKTASDQESAIPQLVLHDTHSHLEASHFEVIKDEKSLKLLFAQLNKTRKPGIPLPQVDFNREILLFYGPGIINGMRDIELHIQKESQDSIMIAALDTLNSPKGELITTSPFCLYSLPKTGKTIVFIEKE
ncbi:hypothetical protein [Arenibacter amylolyticus]|uniref:hypothetical protein n=1 Tax=Arenibacter amylolyticus TaxID=1406873 RepID=UPI0011226DBD|nr:hypothetical protein [Arenibacter amylolyticus]